MTLNITMAKEPKTREVHKTKVPLKKDPKTLNLFIARGFDATKLAGEDPAIETITAFLTRPDFEPNEICETDVLRGSPPKKT